MAELAGGAENKQQITKLTVYFTCKEPVENRNKFKKKTKNNKYEQKTWQNEMKHKTKLSVFRKQCEKEKRKMTALSLSTHPYPSKII